MSATVLYMSMSLEEFMSTGAVVARRGTFEPADGWGGDHHDGVPIFILTRHDPNDLRQWQLVTYVNDVTSAMTQAKEAAGDKNVLVHRRVITVVSLGTSLEEARWRPAMCAATTTTKRLRSRPQTDKLGRSTALNVPSMQWHPSAATAVARS
jgi:hypothetical protein